MTKQMMIILVLVVYLFVSSVFIEPNSLKITTYEIENQRLQGTRIAFLTDLHLKKHGYKRLDKIVQMTNDAHPDLVLLGGDYANGHSADNMMDINIIGEKLKLITAPKVSVLGNHDWWANGQEIAKGLRQNGVYVLENSARRFVLKSRKTIDVIGLADLDTRTVQIAKAFRKTRRPRIVLTHNPDVYFDIFDETDLILAGHTHGGQFVIPFMPPLFVPSKYGAEFASGLVDSGQNPMIISKGIGTSVLPIRFNCKPEIVIVDFVKKGQSSTPRKKKKARYLK